MNLILQNRSAESLDFILEPWGDVYAMPAGAAFELRSTDDSPEGTLFMEYAEAKIVAYAWPGSIIEVFHDGRQLGGSPWRSPVPGLPPGMSVPEFFGIMGMPPADIQFRTEEC